MTMSSRRLLTIKALPAEPPTSSCVAQQPLPFRPRLFLQNAPIQGLLLPGSRSSRSYSPGLDRGQAAVRGCPYRAGQLAETQGGDAFWTDARLGGGRQEIGTIFRRG